MTGPEHPSATGTSTLEQRLKGRPPYPFETIGVAVAFSPRLQPLLCEAQRLAHLFGSRLLLIHVGRRTTNKETVLLENCRLAGISPEVQPIWQEGSTISSLLAVCKTNMVDLLVLGALQQENVFRYYLGSVARGLSRKAKCSLLLLTEPIATGSTFKEIVVNCVEHPKTVPTLNTVFYFANTTGSNIHIVKEVDESGLAMAMSDDITTGERSSFRQQLRHEAEAALRRKISSCSGQKVQVKPAVLFGRPGYTIRRYAEECHADLLVINSPDSRYGLMDRIFTHDMEYILEALPCNMMIVHSRHTSI
jgi:nucleotide-binding universal stress UspA family protein